MPNSKPLAARRFFEEEALRCKNRRYHNQIKLLEEGTKLATAPASALTDLDQRTAKMFGLKRSSTRIRHLTRGSLRDSRNPLGAVSKTAAYPFIGEFGAA
jgi:hypothetical protein